MPWLTFSANPRELVNTTLTKKLWQPGPPLQLRTAPPMAPAEILGAKLGLRHDLHACGDISLQSGRREGRRT